MTNDPQGMKRLKAALTVALMLVSLPAMADDKAAPPHATLLGVFNPVSPESARDLGARAVRIFVHANMLEPDKRDEIIRKLAEYKHAGFTVIATVSFGNKKDRTPLPDIDSLEWKAKIERFESFLRVAGTSIDYVALGNEPTIEMAESDFFPRDNNGTTPVVEFFKALAAGARDVIKSDAKFYHMKISSPALFNLQFIDLPGHGDGHLAYPLLTWEIDDPNIDVIDIHTHVAKAAEIDHALKFLEQRTKKPVIITEWSQAAAAKEWLDEDIDKGFADKWKITTRRSNWDFIDACYANPVSKKEWDEFVAQAPYDPAFMNKAFAVMRNHHVLVATYGAGKQVGNEKFDAKQLMANLTVVPESDGKPQENYLFATWYRDLAQAYNAGKLNLN